MKKHVRVLATVALLSLPALPTFALRASTYAQSAPADKSVGKPVPSLLGAGPVVTGPAHGALVIVGGGKVGNEILTRMFDLAGGKDAPMVVIPTASGADDYPADWSGLRMFKTFRRDEHHVLHTKDRKVADSEAFVKPITNAGWSGSSADGSGVSSTRTRTPAPSAKSKTCWRAAGWSPARPPARQSSPRTWFGARARTTTS
jgi:hypothetical protein